MEYRLPRVKKHGILPLYLFMSPTTQSRLVRSLIATGLVFLEFAKVVFLAGITIVSVRYFLFKPFYVKGASMEPNFYEHEYLIVDELSYRLREPERGEVVVLVPPVDQKEYFLKRIVGLPGERVQVSNGKVTVFNTAHPEGITVEESYIPQGVPTTGDRIWTLGPNKFFVLGDNRENSYDSRRFGPIDRSEIVGRAWIRGYPLNRVQTFSAPAFSPTI